MTMNPEYREGCQSVFTFFRAAEKVALNILIGVLRLYKLLVSPWLGYCCRFYPSCSEFACICLKKYGLPKGLYLSIKRILRCHPWNPGGYDPAGDSTAMREV